MNAFRMWWVVLIGAAFLLQGTGCRTTPKIDWNARVGTYTFDQAVMDYGPPDKFAKLNDGTGVGEWLTRRGTVYIQNPYPYPFYGPYPYGYGPYFGGFVDTWETPNYYLRLIFGPDGKLTSYRKFSR